MEFLGNTDTQSTTVELQKLKQKTEYKEAQSISARVTRYDLRPVRQMVVCFLRIKQGKKRFANKF